MHRRVDVERLSNDTQRPFCENRLTHFQDQPTEEAKKRLEKITTMVNNSDRLSGFDGYKLDIPEDIRVLKPALDLQAQVKALQGTTNELKEILRSIGMDLKGAKFGSRKKIVGTAVKKIESTLEVTLPNAPSKQSNPGEG